MSPGSLESHGSHESAEGRVRGIRGFGRALPAAAFAAAIGAQISRRPDLFARPQFFAEDGIYYQQAHNVGGVAPFAWQVNGYLHLLPRLVAGAAANVPLSWAPSIMLVAAAVVCATPAAFVVSRRMETAVPSVWARLTLAGLLVAMPGVGPTVSVLAYSQWYLALVAFMVLVATPPARATGRAADAALLALSGLSGPYSLPLAPVAVAHALTRRTRRDALNAAVVCAAAALQAAKLLTVGRAARSSAPHGASAFLFFRIVGGRVFYGATAGEYLQGAYIPDWKHSFGDPTVVAWVGAIGLALLAVAFALGTHELRMLLAFAGAILAAALVSASVPLEGPPQWVVLANQSALSTYFIIPTAAVYASCVWMIAQRRAPLRVAGGAVLALAAALGVPNDWRVAPVEDLDFPSSVRAYASSLPGTTVRIETPPRPSYVVLVRRADERP